MNHLTDKKRLSLFITKENEKEVKGTKRQNSIEKQERGRDKWQWNYRVCYQRRLYKKVES